MKITELRCPACNGTMKIDEKNQNLAVCEYCGTKYVLEREGDEARIGSTPPKIQYMPETTHLEAKHGPSGKEMAILALAAVVLVCLFSVPKLLGGSGGKGKTESADAVAAGYGAGSGKTSSANQPEAEAISANSLTGTLAEAAEGIFGKPADEITEAELASVKVIGIRYANGGNDLCIDYSREDPQENPDLALESLYFDRSSADLKFESLRCFTGLKVLSASTYMKEGALSGLHLESLSCYAESPKALAAAFDDPGELKELAITAGLDSLEGLELFTGLERLTIDGYDLTELRELAGAKSVQALTLESCDQVTDFSVLSVMTWLKELSVDSENLKALTFLSKMPELTSLELHNAGIINLSGLTDRADTLTSLVVEDCDNLKECSDLSAMTGLKSLYIEIPYNCEEPDLSGLTAMEELTLSGFDTSSFLAAMPGLKKLSLSSSAVNDQSVFNGLANLEELKCTSYSSGLDDLGFIAGLPSLKRLSLTGASTYYDISSLFNIPTLEEFYMNGMECEIDFSRLTDNPSLKVLEMDGIKLYENVKVDGGGGFLYVDWDDVVLNDHTDFLAHYQNLETLSIADNELTQVEFAAGLGSLKTLDISDNYVTDIKPLAGLNSLKTVTLTGNPVDNTRVLGEKVRIVN